jgi:CspA family cold shock protein
MGNSYTGTVKWFNNAKGFGFIQHEPTGEDVFVHFSSIEGDDFKTLKEGEKVEYEIEKGEKGLHASRVTRRWRPVSTHARDMNGSAAANNAGSLADSIEVTETETADSENESKESALSTEPASARSSQNR